MPGKNDNPGRGHAYGHDKHKEHEHGKSDKSHGLNDLAERVQRLEDAVFGKSEPLPTVVATPPE